MSVLIETTLGDLVFDLHTEERPRSTLNFLKLCKIKYYNYCLFHSVRRNFIAQCGDPTGTGRGGESIYSFVYGDQAKYFDLEPKPRIKHKTKGTISFVNNGNDKHGSQFFITLGEGLDFLDGKHTIFGVLSEGFETLEKINQTICDESHKPYRDVRITHTIILYDPFDDPKGLTIPDRSPEPTQEQLESGRIGADEDVDDAGKTKEEIQKELEDKELQIGTKILETVGDINEADEKPPENVLFVCKLNPITKADDLKIIFSRFGKIKSCEIVKDQKTGDSLCYGFVEFKEVESCEKAYFKMDNVLIDDRRIHVDFCQSVGKMKKDYNNKPFSKREERPGQRVYDMKEDRTKKNGQDKYSMLFDEENPDGKVRRKNEKKIHQDDKRGNNAAAKDKSMKKRRGSESENERTPVKKNSEKKVSKEAPPKRRKSPSFSHSDDETKREKKPTAKKSNPLPNKNPIVKKRPKNDKKTESESPSSSSEDDDEEHGKKIRKKKLLQKKSDAKVEDTDKKIPKKEKKRDQSEDSDSDKESKRKLKRRKSDSDDSDSEDETRNKSKKKDTKKDKVTVKKKRKDDSDDEQKSIKRNKLNKSKKTKAAKTKPKSADESDSEDDAKVKGKSRQKKRSDRSSDSSSSADERKKQSKTVRPKHNRRDSSDDDRKKKSHKKPIAKKKVRKRYASSDSDSSD